MIAKYSKSINNLFVALIFLFCLCIPLFVYLEKYRGILFLFVIPVFFIFLPRFKKSIIFFFVLFLFTNFHFDPVYKIQFITFVCYFAFLIYLTNPTSEIFNSLNIPRTVLIAGLILLISIFTSAMVSQFVSVLSIYHAYLFFTFLSASFIVFKLTKSVDDEIRYLNYFKIGVFVSCCIIILQILVTGNLRSVGLAGFPIMDFIIVALIFIVFYNYLLTKAIKFDYLVFSIIFIVFITTQSRFAWFGFLLSFIYGLLILFKFSRGSLDKLKKSFFSLVLLFSVSILLVFISGLDKVIFSRVLNINFDFFSSFEEGAVVTNSLESRILIWLTAYETFIHNPIFGVGYLMFGEISESYNILPQILFDNYVATLDAHTTFLNFLVETGVVGLMCFLAYVISIFVFSFKALKLAKTKAQLDVSIIMNILVFFVIVHSIYSGAFTYGTNAYLMHYIFGLTIANFCILKNANLY